MARLNEAKAALVARIKADKLRLQESSPLEPVLSEGLLDLLRTNNTKEWPSPALAEMRRLLGLAWTNSPDYVLVSKASLRQVSLNGVAGDGTLTPTICDVLAVAPEQRASLEALVRRAETDYAAWAQANVKRMEPSADIVAHYVIPANPSLAQRLSAEGAIGVLGVLGAERTSFSQGFATEWVQKHGFLGQAKVSLAVRRLIKGGQPHIQAKCDNFIGGGCSSSGWSDLTPHSFPAAFRAIFPGGWSDLAKAENFSLPENFRDERPAPQ
jgi:hypothetical protein